MFAYILWSLCCLFLLIYGLLCYFSKGQRTFGFWANVPRVEVEDVIGYNKALGKLFIFFFIAMELLGLPLLAGQNSGLIVISILGTSFLGILCMVIYVIVIEPKYRKKS